jgi:hypothetical protein
MTWLRIADPGMAWGLEAARIWLVVFGCAAAGWVIGFGMGYRRGVRDAIADDLLAPDHRFTGE